MKQVILLVFSIFLLLGCASAQTGKLGNYYQSTATTAPTNMAQLYIFRPTNPNANPSWISIYVNRRQVTTLTKGAYTEIVVPPGHYVITTALNTHWYSAYHAMITADLASNQTYYLGLYDKIGATARLLFTGSPTMGVVPMQTVESVGYHFKLLNQQAALPDLSTCRFVKPKLYAK